MGAMVHWNLDLKTIDRYISSEVKDFTLWCDNSEVAVAHTSS